METENRWIKAPWRRGTFKVENAVVIEVGTAMEEVSMRLKFKENAIHPRKTSSIMSMVERMVEMRSWKVARGMIEDRRC